MHLVLFLITAIALASGRAAPNRTSGSFGYFNPAPIAEHDKTLADDAARQLATFLPPATTRLELRQAHDDTFGLALVASLRGRGFALEETVESAPLGEQEASQADVNHGTNNSIALNYVMDTIKSPTLYRVTLRIGEQTLSRAYLPNGAAIHPAGAWILKE